jgi:hypothetical protein
MCIQSAQEVYLRLLLRTPDNATLNFDVLALLGVQRDGALDHHKVKDLIRLFRPDRDGTLNMLDFVKSVDAVYKELRLLRAAVLNSSYVVGQQSLVLLAFSLTTAFKRIQENRPSFREYLQHCLLRYNRYDFAGQARV